jgi:hypothetical protein
MSGDQWEIVSEEPWGIELGSWWEVVLERVKVVRWLEVRLLEGLLVDGEVRVRIRSRGYKYS